MGENSRNIGLVEDLADRYAYPAVATVLAALAIVGGAYVYSKSAGVNEGVSAPIGAQEFEANNGDRMFVVAQGQEDEVDCGTFVVPVLPNIENYKTIESTGGGESTIRCDTTH